MAATERTPPPPVRGHRPKLFYATQAAVAPPTFVFFASDAVGGPLQLPALPREPAARARSASTARRSGSSSATASSVKLPRRKKLRSAPVGVRQGPGAAGPPGGHASRADARWPVRGSRSSGPARGARRWPARRPDRAGHARCATPRRRRHGSPRPGATSATARDRPADDVDRDRRPERAARRHRPRDLRDAVGPPADHGRRRGAVPRARAPTCCRWSRASSAARCCG